MCRMQTTSAATGTSASDVWVVGDAGPILHYNGTSWSSVSIGTMHTLRSVWGTSASDVWAVGYFYNGVSYSGSIFHYNGTSWSRIMGTISIPALNSIWGTSASDVWAVGDGTNYSAPFPILHYDGATWSNAPSPTTFPRATLPDSGATWAADWRG